MKFARSLRFLLAAALLVAWQNALVHPIEHVDEAGEFIHLAGGHGGEHRNDRAPDPLCDAIAALGACVNGSSNTVAVSSRVSEAPDCGKAAIPSGALFLAYRSQAPPLHS